MSNYINNLINRNRHAAEVVRPRLPSIFEPPPVETPAAFHTLHLVTPAATPQAADEAINPRPLQARQAASRASVSEPPPAGETLDETHIPNAPSPEAQIPEWRGLQQPPVIHERAAETQVLPQEAAPSSEPPSFTPRPIGARDRDNRVVNVAHSSLDQPAGRPPSDNVGATRDIRLSQRPFVPPKDETVVAERRERHSVQAEAQPPPPPPNRQVRQPAHEAIAQRVIEESKSAALPVESSDNRIVVQPRITRRDEHYLSPDDHRPRQERVAFQAEPPPLPTINVTIGRIEVIALPPAAAPPRPQKTAAPLMSLEEYMRRRNGGGDPV
jgi:hypothetical protein